MTSQSPNYSFTVTANRNLVAHFVTACAVTLALAGVGRRHGDGVYNGGVGLITATPASASTPSTGPRAACRSSNSPNYTFTANNNRTLQANFALGAASVMYDFDTAEPPCYRATACRRPRPRAG
ncbi:MAG: hypothetical protein U0527_14080 [Candidatus Eisenbacteria bacterium]